MKGPAQIVVRVPSELYADLNAVAEQLGRTISELIREMAE